MTSAHDPADAVECGSDKLLESLSIAYAEVANTRFDPDTIGLLDTIKSPPQSFDFSAQVALKLHQASKSIRDLIVCDPRFPGSTVIQIRRDSGGSGFYPNFVAVPLIRVAILKGSPIEAICWLQKVLSTTEASGKIIHAMWGVPVEKEIALTDEISIVPFDMLPDSDNKKRLATCCSESPVASMLDFVPPQSALVAPFLVRPLLSYPERQSKPLKDSSVEVNDLLHDIQLVLSIVGPRVTTLTAQWFEFDDPDIEMARIGSSRRSRFIEILPNKPPEYPALDADEAVDIVKAYLSLKESVLNKVRVSLNRFQDAQKRRSIGDRAVELSTAFETLLGDGQTSEMTHKMKVRCARLLGGSAETRKFNFEVMGWMYSARSKRVHTGQDESKGKSINEQALTPLQLVDCATSVCMEVIKWIVRNGSIPDWGDFDIS